VLFLEPSVVVSLSWQNPVAHCWSDPGYFKRKFCNLCRRRLEDSLAVRCESKSCSVTTWFLRVLTTSKGEGKGLDTCYSATYMSQTRDQQRFTISDVVADWHEPMVPQRIMWPSIVRANPLCS